MRNLLPKDKKKIVDREYLLRAIVVSLWLAFLVCGIGVVLILPSYLLVQSQTSALYARKNLIDQTMVIQKEDVAVEDLKKAQKYIQKLKGATEKSFSRELLNSVIRSAPVDVDLTGFMYKSALVKGKEEGENGGKSTLRIKGIASDRSTLILFSDTLRKLDSVSEVNLPVSQLARRENIPFTLTLEGKI